MKSLSFCKKSALIACALWIFTAQAAQAEVCVVQVADDILSQSERYYGSSVRSQWASVAVPGAQGCSLSSSALDLDDGQNNVGFIPNDLSGEFPEKWILVNTTKFSSSNNDFYGDLNVDTIVFKKPLELKADAYTLFGNASAYSADFIDNTNLLLDYNNQNRDATFTAGATSNLQSVDHGRVVLDFRTNFKDVDFKLDTTERVSSAAPSRSENINFANFPLKCSADSKPVALWNTVILLPDAFYTKYRNNSLELKKIIFDESRPETACLRDFGANYVCVGELAKNRKGHEDGIYVDPTKTWGNTIDEQNGHWCKADLIADETVEPTQPNTWYRDADGDTYGDASVTTTTIIPIAPVGYTDNADDCNDKKKAINPDAEEICDNADNNCDGYIDQITNDGGATYVSVCSEIFYEDLDGDGFGSDVVVTSGGVNVNGDCNDADAAINPNASEICGDNIDQNCDGLDNICSGYEDLDGDGFGSDVMVSSGGVNINGDCNDTNATVNPNAPEVCGDSIDQNCDGFDDDCNIFFEDLDGDGFGGAASPNGTVAVTGDCNDTNAAQFPGNPEICDSIDNDCDSLVDENTDNTGSICVLSYEDLDGDGVGGAESANGTVSVGGDCDDNNPVRFPNNPEICDQIDNDCDTFVDETADGSGSVCVTFYEDLDGDGFGGEESTTGTVVIGGDCDDTNPLRFPNNIEICGDNIDQNCDGDDLACSIFYQDTDGDGFGDDGTATTEDPGTDTTVTVGGDCNDANETIYPGAPEICNFENIDHDCDGLVNEDNVCIMGDIDPNPSGSVVDGFIKTDGGALVSGCSLNGNGTSSQSFGVLFGLSLLTLVMFRKRQTLV